MDTEDTLGNLKKKLNDANVVTQGKKLKPLPLSSSSEEIDLEDEDV